MALTTLEIVEREIKRDNFPTMEHMAKLFTICDGRIGFCGETYRRLSDNGFKIFVDGSFVSKFTYHAVVKGTGETPPVYWRFPAGGALEYIGDIPDKVLDRAQRAVSLGINYLTLHSMTKLKVQRPYTAVDPVMLGWINNPMIREEAPVRIGNSQMAVVVGVWDYEEEVALLEGGTLF